MKKAEEILRTYVDFEDVNGSEPVTLLPLTVIDAMEEYATQCQEDMADMKYTEENIKQAIIYGMNTKQIDWGMVDEFIKSLNKQE